MSNIHLNITQWAALAPGLSCRSDWQQWASGNKDIADSIGKLDLPQIPAMLRRRLSPMGKAALWCAYQLVDNPSDHACVFCSQHGEVARTMQLLDDLAQQQPLSPTAFSLSVHNAIGGIHSIARKDTSNITAISAGPDSICAALLEARALLEQPQCQQVLCLVYDTPLPPPCNQFDQTPEFPLALALVINREVSREISTENNIGQPLTFSLSSDSEDLQTPQPLQAFIKFLLSEAQETLTINSGPRQWQWHKPQASSDQ
jgi:hypothetical protein